MEIVTKPVFDIKKILYFCPKFRTVWQIQASPLFLYINLQLYTIPNKYISPFIEKNTLILGNFYKILGKK